MCGDFVLWMPHLSRWNWLRSYRAVPLVKFLNVLSTCRDYGLGKPSTFTEWCGDFSLTSVGFLNTLCISMWCGDRGRPALPRFRIGPYPGDVGPDPKLGSGWERSGERGPWVDAVIRVVRATLQGYEIRFKLSASHSLRLLNHCDCIE